MSKVYELGNNNVLTRNGKRLVVFRHMDEIAAQVRKLVNDHNRLDRAVDRMMGWSDTMRKLREWKDARTAFLALPSGSPDARAALDRLANAEDALFRSED